MAYQQREQHDNSGILFKNDKKSRDADRDYGGNATIGGVEYWVSGWIKSRKDGKGKYMTFSFKPKVPMREWAETSYSGKPKTGLKPAPKVEEDFNDAIPF